MRRGLEVKGEVGEGWSVCEGGGAEVSEGTTYSGCGLALLLFLALRHLHLLHLGLVLFTQTSCVTETHSRSLYSLILTEEQG